MSSRLPFFTLLVAGVAGCSGQIGDLADEDGPDSDLQCVEGGVHPGPSPVRRMTRFEYNNTLRDLLGDDTSPANTFFAEEESLGFNNIAQNLTVSPQQAEKYMTVAEEISQRFVADPARLSIAAGGAARIPSCNVDKTSAACVSELIAAFAGRAYRRPPTPDETAALEDLYRAGVRLGGHKQGLEMVVEAVLQSPTFLYRLEWGVAHPALGLGVSRLTSWEMASRLSFFLWGSMPDDALFVAAEQDQLRMPEQIEAQARRMIEDPRARGLVTEFHAQWLDYNRLTEAGKDPQLFPDWSKAVGNLMQEETRRFIDHVVFDDAGDLKTLLTAPYSYLDAELAAFYGITSNAGTEFTQVNFTAGERAGLLTQGSFLARNAHTNQTSPVHRGKWVRENLLCGILAPPPANFEAPKVDPNASTRERFKQHFDVDACRGCHLQMDYIGFGFEQYDAIGRYRAYEAGEPIDDTGTIYDTDVAGDFNGPIELVSKLAESEDVAACYALQWFRYANGRGNTTEDECTIDRLDEKFNAAKGNVKELLVLLTQTDAFLYRTNGEAQ